MYILFLGSQISISKGQEVKKGRINIVMIKKKIKKTEEENLVLEEGGESNKHRHNVVEILMNSNATPIRNRGDIGYVCYFCSEQFPNPADLKTHSIESHDQKSIIKIIKERGAYRLVVRLDITNLKCNICDKSIETLEQIINHLKDVHNKKLFTDIKNQILPFKFDSDELKCFMCDGVFNRFKLLSEHMNKHYRNYICKVCDTGFVIREFLAQHASSHKIGTFNCVHCSKVFNTAKSKQVHEKYAHTSSSFNKCGYCNERFKDYRKKKIHLIEVHGDQLAQVKIQCNACDKTFFTQGALTTHKKKDHLMIRRFQCPDCDKKFYGNSDLKHHMIKHTGTKEFVCEICHKAYGRRKTLNEHLRIHANDRRFKCVHCSQAFVQKTSWRGHMRSKHGEEL